MIHLIKYHCVWGDGPKLHTQEERVTDGGYSQSSGDPDHQFSLMSHPLCARHNGQRWSDTRQEAHTPAQKGTQRRHVFCGIILSHVGTGWLNELIW